MKAERKDRSTSGTLSRAPRLNRPRGNPLITLACGLALLCSPVAFAQQPELVVQQGHAKQIYAIAFSPDGQLIASGSEDSSLKLWDSATGLELRTLSGHTHWINCVAFSADGKLLASGSSDKSIRIFEVATGRTVRTLDHAASVQSLAFLPNGKTLVSGSNDHAIQLWDVATGQVRRTLTGHTREIRSISVSSDGRTLASASYDRTIRLWDLATGQSLRTIAQRAAAMAMSPDGRTIATGGYSLQLWDAATGNERRKLEQFQQETPDSRGSPGASLAFSADSRLLASVTGDGSMKVWNVASGAMLWKCCRHFSSGLAFSPDGKTLAAGGMERKITLWNTAHGTQMRTLVPHSDSVHSVAFSPDGRALVVGRFMLFEQKHEALKSWDLVSGQPPVALPGDESSAYNATFSADGKQLASGGLDNNIVIRDFAARRVLRVIAAGGPVDHLTASRDGKLLASASRDSFVRLWDPSAGRLVRKIEAHPVVVRAVALSPDGKLLASAGHDRLIKIWDPANGQQKRTVNEYADQLVFSPDGRTLAFGGGARNSVSVLDPATGTIRSMAGGHEVFVTNLLFSPDSKLLASAGRDWKVKLWNVATGQLVRTIVGHANDVQGLAFSPDGKLLATASWDGSTKLWDVASGTLLATLLLVDEDDWLVVTPEGLFDGSPGAWNKILWRFSSQLRDVAPVEIFFNELFYPGLLTDVIAGKRPQATRSIQAIDRRQPQVTMFQTEGMKIGKPRVKVRIDIAQAPAGAQDLRLMRNGTLVKVWRGELPVNGSASGTGGKELEIDVPLVPGKNLLTAYAFNKDNVKSSDAVLSIDWPESPSAPRTTYVLAAGVDEYANPEFNLSYAVADAEEFSAEFRRQQLRLTPGARVEIVSLHNKGATKTAILRALADLAGRVQPQDTVAVFFAGHGLANGKRFYLIPHDLGYTGARGALGGADLKTVLTHAISDRELERAFEGVDAGRLLLVIDACNSGQALEAAERRRGPMNSPGLAQLAYEKGMYVLTAAQSYQAALERSDLQHGLLTYALVEEGMKRGAADDAPKDGTILLREWFDYATSRVPLMQMERMRQAGQRGIKLVYVAGDESIAAPEQRNVQRPRVFYRRELEARPFVVARPNGVPKNP